MSKYLLGISQTIYKDLHKIYFFKINANELVVKQSTLTSTKAALLKIMLTPVSSSIVFMSVVHLQSTTQI